MPSNKDKKTSIEVSSPTLTPVIPLNTGTGSSGSTKPTSATSTKLKLEEEAQEFRAKKRFSVPPKPMTSRIYLIGMAMNALLSRSQGPVRREEIKREAEEWADYILSDD